MCSVCSRSAGGVCSPAVPPSTKRVSSDPIKTQELTLTPETLQGLWSICAYPLIIFFHVHCSTLLVKLLKGFSSETYGETMEGRAEAQCWVMDIDPGHCSIPGLIPNVGTDFSAAFKP